MTANMPAPDSVGPLSRIVLDYSVRMKAIVDAAKAPGFSEASWAPLAGHVDTARFVRVGNFKETMDWAGYIAMLTRWVPDAIWHVRFRRVTENENVVLLGLEEYPGEGPDAPSVNSMSVYEFDAAGKLIHLDIYLQQEGPSPW